MDKAEGLYDVLGGGCSIEGGSKFVEMHGLLVTSCQADKVTNKWTYQRYFQRGRVKTCHPHPHKKKLGLCDRSALCSQLGHSPSIFPEQETKTQTLTHDSGSGSYQEPSSEGGSQAVHWAI